MRIPIKTNVFMIPERLKEIDKNYFVVFNTKIQKFEVHYKEQLGSTLAVTVPYDELDARTIELVHKTRIENIEQILAEMDKRNLELELSKERELTNKAQDMTREIFNYAKKSEHREAVPEHEIKEFRR